LQWRFLGLHTLSGSICTHYQRDVDTKGEVGPTVAAASCMIRRLLAPALLAFALAGSYHVSTAAASHRYLICETEPIPVLHIDIENFGGMSGAVEHCVHFWNGHPIGVE